jgi:hypothetical protein
VAADDKQVYLGWSLAEYGKAIMACDPAGHVLWSHRRAEGASGCVALAVDDGLLYVLGGLKGVGAEGGTIYRLNTKDGKPVPWPNGAIDLKITSLWPADGKSKPDKADAMAVRHGRIYLSFTSSEFLSVVDAKTGAYVQTIVGASMGPIDVAPTQTESPDTPGKLIDADFALIALGGGVLGRVLIIHDPLWVPMSDMSPSDRDVRITALAIIGDRAKFHHHTAYVAFGAPSNQVEARPLLDPENTTWTAGRLGGRPLLGPWQAEALRSIRGIALAPDGKLWVAEGDAFPKRFSVWDTDGKEGKLVSEFFGPAEHGAPGAAINPLDPDLMFAQGCEWRIDRKTGQAKCLGVITRDPVEVARYGVGENGHAYLVVGNSNLPGEIFERVGDGDYKLRSRFFYVDAHGTGTVKRAAGDLLHMRYWSDENGDGEVQPNELHDAPWPTVLPVVATQDLTLQFSRGPEDSMAPAIAKVKSWTACGAPIYDAAQSMQGGEVWHISADGRLQFSAIVNEFGLYDVDGKKALWDLRLPDEGEFRGGYSAVAGGATLPKPLGNVWLVSRAKGAWHLINEDGFDLASFFGGDPAENPNSAKATPGMDMTHAAAGRDGSITQAADGKLYIAAGETAYWNLEVTGLDKVKALPGGTINIPPAK